MRRVLIIAAVVCVAFGVWVWRVAEPFAPEYDATYVGSTKCGQCHTQVYDDWRESSHAKMTRRPTPESVVGDFDDHAWTLPPDAQRSLADTEPAARMFREGDKYFMALRHPERPGYVPFEIAWVIGYQYRQVYLTLEPKGVLRRLPLQWSVPRQAFFPYWNMQEASTPSVADLWMQMRSQNSAWNLFCARCHTTNLEILAKDKDHTAADTRWTEPGIACEACHGPGSRHIEYFRTNYANRFFGFLDSDVRGRRAAYIASAPKLSKGTAMSVCARCHGTDIRLSSTDVFREYEPGFSRTGKTNDLSSHFKEVPLTPNRTTPTVEIYADGQPKGIGMLFRSMIESKCYEQADVRCHDCHDAHDNRKPAVEGILEPSAASDAYCLGCHEGIAARVDQHTRHEPNTPGAHCYDCHLPKSIVKIAAGIDDFTRTHELSSIPRPANTVRFGQHRAPNACTGCHADQSPAWADELVRSWSTKSAAR
ncbi:MAG: multiheme c-type cytochrome [Deltaproteobacteria bacterium]